MSRLSASPGRRPGNASDRDHAIRVPRVGSSTVGNVKSSDSRPNNRVSSFTGSFTAPCMAVLGEPISFALVTVAVVNACL